MTRLGHSQDLVLYGRVGPVVPKEVLRVVFPLPTWLALHSVLGIQMIKAQSPDSNAWSAYTVEEVAEEVESTEVEQA